jgi:hypothetical protein
MDKVWVACAAVWSSALKEERIRRPERHPLHRAAAGQTKPQTKPAEGRTIQWKTRRIQALRVDQHLTAHGNYWAGKAEAASTRPSGTEKASRVALQGLQQCLLAPPGRMHVLLRRVEGRGRDRAPRDGGDLHPRDLRRADPSPAGAVHLCGDPARRRRHGHGPFPRRGRVRRSHNRHAGPARVREGRKGNILDIQYFKPL